VAPARPLVPIPAPRISPEAVEQLLGRMSAGHVLITSRLGDWSAQVEELDLDVLGEDAAVEFLLKRTEGKQARSWSLAQVVVAETRNSATE
jgi:hypothetical protein